ncbi:LysR family transcriptional regulator [Pseudoruegeria sp. HB172150]|uniref:LysR family transcriptional regulator n=1 Tax=Pseudoruegeria sp. HB172150 TaxID=2721164 RepID=UPI00155198CA|nr:LysR family transcriptional regulator [Pseudoruegeria sp. HB172150]
MKLDHLEGFVGVANAGTFRKAAKDLCIGQPALSRKIQALEFELGVPLFRRSPVGAELTPAGQFLLTRTHSLLTDLERVKRDMRIFREDTGYEPQVTIAIGTTYALAQDLFPVVARRLKQIGSTSIDVRFHEQTTEQLKRHVDSGALDIALMGDFKATSDHDVISLGQDHLCLVSPAEDPNDTQGSIDIASLAKVPIVTYYPGHGPRIAMDAAFRRADLIPSIEAEAGTLSTILSHIRLGTGYGIVPMSSMAAADRREGFRITPVTAMSIDRNLVIRRNRAPVECGLVKQVVLEEAQRFLYGTQLAAE